MPNVCVPGILGVLAARMRLFGGVCNCACSKARKYERLLFAISPLCAQIFETRRAESEFCFCIHPRLFLENRKPCFQLGKAINSIVRRENLLLFRCSASFGRCDLAVYEIFPPKKLVL